MGVTGLLPLLRSITRRVSLKQLAGQAVAVDAYSWLHKGIYGACAVDLFNNRPNRNFVEFCMARIKMLLHFQIRPILVFDGGPLPMKSHREAQRAKVRQESRDKAHELIKAGKGNAAFLQIQKATDVTPRMAAELICELQRCKIDFIVAPYEADAQMAWLDRTGKVAAVITEDSDLLLFGCKRVLFKLDRDGWAEEICLDRLSNLQELDLSLISYQKFRHMCMLSGCDYLASINGLGLRTAYKYICRYADIQRALRAEMGHKMPEDYVENFFKADLTFCHQRIYDTDRQCTAPLSPLCEAHERLLPEDLDFLGPYIEDGLATLIAKGLVCPIERRPFNLLSLPLPVSIPIPSLPSSLIQKQAFSTVSSQESSLSTELIPLEICLDSQESGKLQFFAKSEKATQDDNSQDDPAISAKDSARAIARPCASRITLKRSFSSTLQTDENQPPSSLLSARLKSFAYSTETIQTDRAFAGLSSYMLHGQQKSSTSTSLKEPPSKRTSSRPNSQPIVDLKQRPIDDFFKTNPSTQ